MKPEFEQLPLTISEAKHRFEIDVNGSVAFIEYEQDEDGIIALVHTEAPKELEGTGAAAALVEKTFLHIEEQKKLIQPFCPYIFAYIKRHPEWKRLVYQGFPAYHQL